jgi:calcium-dependent protein kinase
VYRGVRKSDRRAVAIKEISKAAGNLIELRGEHTAMAHMQSHANVVELVDYIEDRAQVFIVMELCQGDMWSLIQNREDKYSEADAAATLRQIVRVVAHGHSLGVIHRDLKPDNFLVSDDGKTLKCTDFGFAVLCPTLEYRDNGPRGTTEYLPPEAFGGIYSDKSDIWACGIILYILLTGLFPFPDRHSIKSEHTVPFPVKEFAKVSDNAKDLVCVL